DSENEKIVNAKEKKYKVVGIMNRPGFENGIVTGITYLDINSLAKNEKINVSIAVNNPKEVYEIASNISKNLNLKSTNEVTEEDLTEDNGMHYSNDTGMYYENVSFNEHLLRLQGASKYAHVNDTLTKLLGLVTLLVVVCTIATVYNAFSISISERKKQFGILNSIGATKSQVMKLVFIEAVLVSIVGIPVGILSGTVAMDIVFKVVNKLFANSFIAEMDLRVVYNPYIIILSIVIVLVTIIISAILPAMSAAKISPLEAIKNSSNLKVGKVKDSKIVRALFKTEGVLAYKNLRRNKKKFRITLFSLIVSVVIFISFSGFMGLFIKSNEIYSGMMNFDFTLYSNGHNSAKIDSKVVGEMKKISGINKFAIDDTFYLSTYVKEDKVKKEYLDIVQERYQSKNQNNEKVYEFINDTLLIPGEDAIKDLKLLECSFDKDKAIKENGVILLNKSYYEEPGKKGEIRLTDYKVGDEIEIYTNEYDEEGNETSKKVEKLKILATTDDLLTGRQYNDMGLDFITYEEVGKNIGFEPYQNRVVLSTNQEESTRNSLKEFADKYEFSYYDEVEEAKAMEESNMAIQVFVYGFITVISLVSVTNIVNTISTNINLRKKELAIIKSIGVTPGGFNKMIYLESLLYGALALIYGVPMGLGLVYLMNTILGDVI
ncbi:MAG: ABC transporter permease, partial [Peptostreptococcaceae bacterium]